MNNEVLFLMGTQSAYNGLAIKTDTTFYYTTDTKKLYIGSELITNAADLVAAISRIAANEGAISSLQSTLTTLQGDANVSGSIRNMIQAVIGDGFGNETIAEVISGIQGQIDTLNADASTTGSVKKTVAEEIAKVVAGASADFDTLKEIADWISTHGTDAAAMASDINTLKSVVGTIPAGAQSNNLVDYIAEMQYDPTSTADPTKCLVVPENAYQNDMSLTTASFPIALAVQDGAFDGCVSLQSLSLPMVRSIGNRAFRSCIALGNMSIPDCVRIGDSAFEMTLNMTEIYAPNVQVVGDAAFGGIRLSKVDMPSLEVVGPNAFFGTDITDVFAPNIKVIEDSGFGGLNELEEIHLHAVQKIGDLAFYMSRKLKSVYIYTHNVPVCGTNNVFGQTPMDTPDETTGEYGHIYVRANLVNAFKNAEGWSDYADRIVAIPGTEITGVLPTVTVSDAGKVLTVNNQGSWSAEAAQGGSIHWGSFE